jgi:NAD-dependent deacetylase
VLWFGEDLPAAALQQAEAAVQHCDLMLVVVTSGVVYPSAGLVFLGPSARREDRDR